MWHTNNNNNNNSVGGSDLSGSGSGNNAAATETAPRRRNRSKTRKPKFVSLRVQMRQQEEQKEKEKEMKEQVMNLFPLHPENENEKEMGDQDHQNVALLFTSEAPETLNGLLEEESTTATEEEEEEEQGCNLSMRRKWAMEEEANGRWLVRKAMKRRNKEEGREERWVCYSEVTSYAYSSSTTESTATTTATATATLSLKLDYEGVLNAWSHQRSLYVPGDTPLPHLLLPHLHVGWQGNSSSSSGSSVKGCEKEEQEGKGENNKKKSGMRIGEREASVLRYKQKRLNRLFSKRIRYEVRKLNAEKRPRMKGRFVKRD